MYQVKFRLLEKDPWRYGIVASYGEEVEEAKKKGMIIIEDAVLPTCYSVRLEEAEIVEIPFGTPGWDKEKNCSIPGDEYSEYVQNEFDKTREASKKATGLKGKMFSMSVADGRAYYVITKENKKTVRVEWRGFCMDRYTDSILGWECTVDKNRIAGIVRAEEGLSALFAKK